MKAGFLPATPSICEGPFPRPALEQAQWFDIAPPAPASPIHANEETSLRLAESVPAVEPQATPASPSGKPEEKKPSAGLDVTLPSGEVLHFENAEALREPILEGKVPRSATVKVLAAAQKPAGAKVPKEPKILTVEQWAKSNDKLRALYAPIWADTLKGALWGFIVVGIFKVADTAVLFFRVNPPVALLWLWVGALLGSPKWKKQILMAGAVVLYVAKDSIDFGALFHVIQSLFGAWFGVAAFAAVFGVSAGMPVGTIVGAIRARKATCAPDRESEGTRPLIWGFLVPAAVFASAAILYLRVVMPYLIKTLS